jgi:hypothetical protein
VCVCVCVCVCLGLDRVATLDLVFFHWSVCLFLQLPIVGKFHALVNLIPNYILNFVDNPNAFYLI